MSAIVFLGTYTPMVCGIGDYTHFITNRLPIDQWGVISFDLAHCEMPVSNENGFPSDRVWYGIEDRDSYSSTAILDGLKRLDGNGSNNTVLWFQHENNIWRGDDKFTTILTELNVPKLVTFHTLHFQSTETPSGLRRNQYDLLKSLLPNVDGITVFSLGVHKAVTSAFPEYRDKIFGLKHGVHSYPEIAHMKRTEAKKRLHDFLLYDSDIDSATKAALYSNRVFTDPCTVVIGQAGFLDPSKQSELLYSARAKLERIIPGVKIVAIRIGSVRDKEQDVYVEELRGQSNLKNQFLVETRLPHYMLPVAQRAFDVNIYWPRECTQSGALAHALGAGAIIAGRDIEGVGEMLKDAGHLVDDNFDRLLYKIKELLLDQEKVERIEESALKYAADYSWDKQAFRHSEIAYIVLSERYCATKPNFEFAQVPVYSSIMDAPVASNRLEKVVGTVSVTT